jgi:hypothetical protein
MDLQNAMQLQNLIGVRGYVIIFWGGKAVQVDRCMASRDWIRFGGFYRNGDPMEFEVTREDAYKAQFVVTSKARVNWPW